MGLRWAALYPGGRSAVDGPVESHGVVLRGRGFCTHPQVSQLLNVAVPERKA